MATLKKGTAKNPVQPKPTAERPSDVKPVDDCAKQPCDPEPPLTYPPPQEQENSSLREALDKLFQKGKDMEDESKVERILSILNGSSPSEVRHIIEDVNTKVERRLADTLRAAERELEQLRKDINCY